MILRIVLLKLILVEDLSFVTISCFRAYVRAVHAAFGSGWRYIHCVVSCFNVLLCRQINLNLNLNYCAAAYIRAACCNAAISQWSGPD